jgi:Zn-finger nucleic acid-binding protein
MLTAEHPCPECGGVLIIERREGRIRNYRGGAGYEIPADMSIPTCHQCGALWMDSAMASELGRLFEAKRLRRQAPERLSIMPLQSRPACNSFATREPQSSERARSNNMSPQIL